MKAMIMKEFRQMRRDRRTVGLMVGLPVMMLVIFGYAARFDVTTLEIGVVGPQAEQIAASLPDFFDVQQIDVQAGRAEAEDLLRNHEVSAALVTGVTAPTMLIDGSELFSAQSALRRLPPGVQPEVLFNPELETSAVMVPALIGLIMLFVGMVITSLGVVREREQGTLEQLAVMPLRPMDVTIGKIAPYMLVSLFDMVLVTVIGLVLFDVPFRGSIPMFVLYVVVFLFVVLGMGVMVSTLSQSQGEAIQLAIMLLLPQIMLSGMIFPLESMAVGIRWIGYLLPLTWFIEGMKGIFLRGSDVSTLLPPLGVLSVMAGVVFVVSVARFRRDLTPRRLSAGGSWSASEVELGDPTTGGGR